jgi:signal transduction histidine kinase
MQSVNQQEDTTVNTTQDASTSDRRMTDTPARRWGIRVWGEWIFRVHPSITNQEARQRSRLLATILLALLFIGGFSLLSFYSNADTQAKGSVDDLIVLASLFVLAILYVLNRKGYTHFASVILIAVTIFVFASIPLMDEVNFVFVPFLIFPSLLAGVLFRLRVLLAVIVITSAIAFFLVRLASPDNTIIYIYLSQFVAMGNALVGVVIYHLTMVEQIRQRELRQLNTRLLQSEAILEERVTARTRDLMVAAEVATQVSSVLDMEQLLPSIVEQTHAGFGLSEVGIYLMNDRDIPDVDTRTERPVLMLVAFANESQPAHLATSEIPVVTEQMPLPDGGYVVSLFAQHIVAESAHQRTAIIRNDVTSRMAVPMLVGERLVGVLDLQSPAPDAFNDDGVLVINALATQIGIAVENARSYHTAEKARQIAEQANQVKSQFLANMSHELRTPLNAILNFTAFVADGLVGEVSDKQSNMLYQAIGSGKHLLALINDILDITKIESGLMDLFIQEVDFNEALQAVIAVGQGLVKDKSVTLVEAVDPDLPISWGDKRRLRQVFLNVLANAVKFTYEGTVTIRAHKEPLGEDGRAWLVVSIQDTGIGIPSEHHNKVFELFKQIQNDLPEIMGTGLGMPISKYFVEAHGGTMTFESEVNVGTTFFVRLPILTEAQANDITLKNMSKLGGHND